MPDLGDFALDRSGQIPLGALCVIDVVLQKEVWMSHFFDKLESQTRRRNDIAGRVVWIERFEHLHDPGGLHLAGGEGQVLFERFPLRFK